ncbi:MAG TPA: hypothetical protein VM734_26660 [Kofleriaceae bacterium]|nr:hypothetical protein [Kofleriaceae bacterium]
MAAAEDRPAGGGDDLDDEQFGDLRALIRRVREDDLDEEPPAHLDALLMAAARRHAPAPRKTWLQRLRAALAPVVLHPALAGAAALVVVGGAAGVMYLRGGHEVVQPTVSAPGEPAAPAGDVAAAPAGAPSMPAAATVALEHEAEDRAAPTLPPPPRPRVEQAALAPKADSPRRPPRAKPLPPPAPPPPPPPSDRRTAVAGAGDAVVATGDGADEKPATAPVAGVQIARGADELAVQVPAETSAAPPRSDGQAAQLTREARTAAKRGDCGAVATLAARVRALDAAYYDASFARDPELARCLTVKP